MKTQGVNMTQGVIWKQMALFFFPILLGIFFQQLYATTDAIVVGRFAGANALAAVDAANPVLRLALSVFIGLSTGATILISQYYGANKNQELSKTVHNAITFALLAGVLVALLLWLLSAQALRWTSVPDDIFAGSLTYLQVIALAVPLSMVYNIATGILRAIGDSRRPFYFLIISNITNVILDILFVAVFHLGIFGAAVATLISQGLSAILVILVLIRSEGPYQLKLKELKIEWEVMKKVIGIGFPLGFQASMFPIANIIVQANINSYGTMAIAGSALNGKLDFIIWILMDAFAMTISTFSAQNYGARNYARIMSGLKLTVCTSVAVLIIVSGALYFFAPFLTGVIVTDTAVADLGCRIIRYYAPYFFTYAIGDATGACIRGTGRTFRVMILTIVGICVSRVFWIFVMVPTHPDLFFTLMIYPISWIFYSTLQVINFFLAKKEIRQSLEATA
ncbi:MAG: MATE family efflux transporter [Erysipelotrichaceae bacterium]|jgi:putative MATE family efflux protein|nr:MATE family efflux transporter [Erysipelotrichaceae bacterium]